MKRGDRVIASNVRGMPHARQHCRVVLVEGARVLLSYDDEVSDEANAERKACGLPKLVARTRYEVAPRRACAPA